MDDALVEQAKEAKVEELSSLEEGSLVDLKGWVYVKSHHGGMVFVRLRDSTGLVQVVFKKNVVGKEKLELAEKLTRESSIRVIGAVHFDKRAPGGVEVHAKDFEVIGSAPSDYPIRPGVGVSVMLDYRHLHLRGVKMTSVWKVYSEMLKAVREWFEQHGYYEVHVPIFVTAACEGGATLFEVSYFGRKAYLSQSAQMYLEAAIFSLEKVYCVQPSFRAEKSRTRRHLTEFWQVEAEVAFADMWDIIEIEEQLLSYVCQKLKERAWKHLRKFRKKFTPPEPPFPRIKYDEAVDILQSKGVEIEWGEDFGADEERVLSKEFDTPFFVTHYPRQCKAFYHKPDPSNPSVTLSVDMLAPEGYGEISGGGQRIDDYQELVESIKLFGLKVEDYGWYLDLRKYGSVPHSGFGIGLGRTLQWILKAPHIRDVVMFPRTINRVYP